MEPDARSNSNVLPAGTVNELMFTVVHLTAAATSSSEEMVPVQSVAAGAATMNGTNARRAARRRKADIITGEELWRLGAESRRMVSSRLQVRVYICCDTRGLTYYRINIGYMDQWLRSYVSRSVGEPNNGSPTHLA